MRQPVASPVPLPHIAVAGLVVEGSGGGELVGGEGLHPVPLVQLDFVGVVVDPGCHGSQVSDVREVVAAVVGGDGGADAVTGVVVVAVVGVHVMLLRSGGQAVCSSRRVTVRHSSACASGPW